MPLLLRCCIFASCLVLVPAADILVLGDSYAMKSGTDLEKVCPGKEIVNRGVCDTTAYQWATSQCPDGGYAWYSPPKGKSCDAKEAFSETYGTGYTHAWLSVGGNDFIYMMCMEPLSALRKSVGNAIKAVLAAGPDGLKILMTGYCIPMGPIPQFHGAMCADTSLIGQLNSAIRDACNAEPACTFVDGTERCGGNTGSFSDPKYFADTIHLNPVGYQRFFTMPGVRAALGCSGDTVGSPWVAAKEARPNVYPTGSGNATANGIKQLEMAGTSKSSGVRLANWKWILIVASIVACCACAVLACWICMDAKRVYGPEHKKRSTTPSSGKRKTAPAPVSVAAMETEVPQQGSQEPPKNSIDFYGASKQDPTDPSLFRVTSQTETVPNLSFFTIPNSSFLDAARSPNMASPQSMSLAMPASTQGRDYKTPSKVLGSYMSMPQQGVYSPVATTSWS